MVVDFPAPFEESEELARRNLEIHILNGNKLAESPREVFRSNGGNVHEEFDSSIDGFPVSDES